MRVVFISTMPPEPVMTGFAMRIHGILDYLPDEIELLRIYPDSVSDKYPADISFSPVTHSRIRELVSLTPSIILPYSLSGAIQKIREQIIDYNPQLVIVSGIHVFPMVPPGFPILYDSHNVEWHLSRGLLKHSNASQVVRLHRMITMLKLKYWEESIVKKSDFLFACSESDSEYFALLRRSKVPVVYNGTDTEFWSMDRKPEKGLLLLTGDMSYFPNIDASEFLVKEVLPLLKEKGWDGKLVLAGRNPDTRVQALEGDSVIVTGTLDDLRPYYSRAEIMVAPMRIGSGTPLKIVTALAAGLPAITTERVIESLGIENENVLLSADTAEEFSRQIMRLLNNNQMALDMSLKGIKLASEKYSWAAVGSCFWKEVGKLLAPVREKEN